MSEPGSLGGWLTFGGTEFANGAGKWIKFMDCGTDAAGSTGAVAGHALNGTSTLGGTKSG